jgi:hypothetical protein
MTLISAIKTFLDLIFTEIRCETVCSYRRLAHATILLVGILILLCRYLKDITDIVTYTLLAVEATMIIAIAILVIRNVSSVFPTCQVFCFAVHPYLYFQIDSFLRYITRLAVGEFL